MIILITGASHTGKTLLVQRLLERYQYPYLSIDHLKMGLIRSRITTPKTAVRTPSRRPSPALFTYPNFRYVSGVEKG